MGQLSLFGCTELSALRDRTARRNYSAAGEAFRREHERHREWGLRRRHAEKLRRLQRDGSPSFTAPTGRRETSRPATTRSQAGILTDEAPKHNDACRGSAASASTSGPGS